MARRENRGIAALADVARLGGRSRPIISASCIGPRINAGGRIGDAALGARLLVSDDPAECETIAAELDRLNQRAPGDGSRDGRGGDRRGRRRDRSGRGAGGHRHRQCPLARRRRRPDRRRGSRRRFQRPALAIAFQANGIGTGSGRSIVGVDLGHAVRTAVERGILHQGRRPRHGRRPDHRDGAARRAARVPRGARSARRCSPTTAHRLPIDAALSARGATVDLIEMLDKAGPFGAGHPEPVFVLPNHRLAYAEDRRQRPCPHDARLRRQRHAQGDRLPRRRHAARRRRSLRRGGRCSMSPARFRSTSGRNAASRASACSTRPSRSPLSC